MKLVDTHCHLQFDAFDDDRDAVVERALEVGVSKILTLATDSESSYRVIELAERYPAVYAAVGIHPTDAHKAQPGDVERIAKLANHPKVVAIGEIGLDLYWDASTLDVQKDLFLQMLRLAADRDLPVVIHNRRAGKEILQVLDQVAELPLRGVFHCFSEGKSYADDVVRRGFYLSFTGNLTYRKSKLPDVAKHVPLERLLLETDSPFMTPVPMRGKRNEPAFVQYIAEKHAELRGMDADELARVTTDNAQTLFGWPSGTA
ncbi:MAG: TatD family hydrolase [candidate division KSB1 bacterium]|nr:TatD family hydrolase [candidate division KSB1 bacterium]MDQ7065529.1 TatD family hydrolase [candidate division KSB1 bacterium]